MSLPSMFFEYCFICVTGINGFQKSAFMEVNFDELIEGYPFPGQSPTAEELEACFDEMAERGVIRRENRFIYSAEKPLIDKFPLFNLKYLEK